VYYLNRRGTRSRNEDNGLAFGFDFHFLGGNDGAPSGGFAGHVQDNRGGHARKRSGIVRIFECGNKRFGVFYAGKVLATAAIVFQHDGLAAAAIVALFDFVKQRLIKVDDSDFVDHMAFTGPIHDGDRVVVLESVFVNVNVRRFFGNVGYQGDTETGTGMAAAQEAMVATYAGRNVTAMNHADHIWMFGSENRPWHGQVNIPKMLVTTFYR